LTAQLNGAGVRAQTDLRDNYSPGWKFNHWELKVRVYSADFLKSSGFRAFLFVVKSALEI
jgi:hypothetical protein